jgi:hypothetical protein
MASLRLIDIPQLFRTIEALSPSHRAVILNILRGKSNAKAAVWPETGTVDRWMRSLEERIPKAANATNTHMQSFLHSDERGSRYMIQLFSRVSLV